MSTTRAYQSLSTTVRNLTGARRFVGFLPPHGVYLAPAGSPGDDFTYPGSPTELVARQSAGATRRNQQALAAAIAARELEIRHTPAVVLETPNRGMSRQVWMNNAGTLGLLAPTDAPSDSVGEGLRYTQSVAATTWTIDHNLNGYPPVKVYSPGGSDVSSLATLAYPTPNRLVITFAVARTGTAVLNG